MTESHPFFELLSHRVPPSAWDWWEGTAELGQFDRDGFLIAFTVAGRHLGRTPVGLKAFEVTRLRTLGLDPVVTHWGQDDLGRAGLFIRAAATLIEPDYQALVEDCYHVGDFRDRQSILRVLAHLPRGERFLDLAREGARSHVQAEFEAIACENRYPASRFAQAEFNQLVLRALTLGLPIDRVVGLSGRLTAELTRLAAEYGSERRAEGRAVPWDIGRLVTATLQ